jgi:hypothetical protein
MDTMMSFSDNSLATSFLSKDEIRKVCPLAFAKSPTNPAVSDRYVQASSETIIDDMAKLGWYPVQAKQKRAKKNSSGIYSFHMIAFQNPDVKILKENADGTTTIDAYPRIIMTNSHDGFNCFKFMCACFRCVCSNGLIIATDQMVNISIRHINYTFEELRTLVAKAIEAVPGQVRVMNDMKSTILTENEKHSLAEAMVNLRHASANEEPKKVSLETLNEILTPVRDEDKSDDLFTVFNVIQEKMMHGGYHMENKNNPAKTRKVRPIKSFVKDISLNKELFSEAVKYLKAA